MTSAGEVADLKSGERRFPGRWHLSRDRRSESARPRDRNAQTLGHGGDPGSTCSLWARAQDGANAKYLLKE